MNLFLIIGFCFVILYLLLNWFSKASSKKIAKGIRYVIFSVGILLAIILFLVGRYAFTIPILIFLLPLLKLKGGIGLFQLFQLWRLISYLRQTGRYSFKSGTNYSRASSNMSLDEAYNILGCKKGCSKQDVLTNYKKIMSKLHPDKNDFNSTKLSQLISEAKETILKNTKFSFEKNELTVIENGVPKVDKKKFFPSNQKTFKIGIIGRLDLHKGHDDFLRALSLLSSKHLRSISVEFIGGYKDEDYKRIVSYLDLFGLKDVVEIRGYVDLPISEIIFNLDLVAMVTKDFEGFGLTIVEALNLGVPVLATRVGIVPDLFSNESVMTIEPNDYQAMSKAIIKFIETKDKSTFITKEVRSQLKKYDAKYASRRYREHLFNNYYSGKN